MFFRIHSINKHKNGIYVKIQGHMDWYADNINLIIAIYTIPHYFIDFPVNHSTCLLKSEL